MKILVVTQDFPDKQRSVYTFVKQIVDQFSLMSNQCCVIAPYSITHNRSFCQEKEEYFVDDEHSVIVLRPNYISLSEIRIMGFSPTNHFKRNAINRALKRLPFKPDIIYAHFWRSGREIYEYAKDKHIPLFVATGESTIPQNDINPLLKDYYDYVKGVICVSTKNKEESLQNGLTTEDKCIVAPNAISTKLFYRLNRTQCRQKLGMPEDAFIVAFCGALVHRKGVKILSEAIDSIEGQPVYSFFMGRPLGELPSCEHILYQGPVRHEELITYLNAANVLVLPTLHEGCCNAIIEALACGLPVISSDRPFNWDVLNETNSILVNPEDSSAVANAIVKLRDNEELRNSLTEGALQKAKELTIDKRANTIINFIKSKL